MRITCPKCATTGEVNSSYAGRRVRCRCGYRFVCQDEIPAPPIPVAAELIPAPRHTPRLNTKPKTDPAAGLLVFCLAGAAFVAMLGSALWKDSKATTQRPAQEKPTASGPTIGDTVTLKDTCFVFRLKDDAKRWNSLLAQQDMKAASSLFLNRQAMDWATWLPEGMEVRICGISHWSGLVRIRPIGYPDELWVPAASARTAGLGL